MPGGEGNELNFLVLTLFFYLRSVFRRPNSAQVSVKNFGKLRTS